MRWLDRLFETGDRLDRALSRRAGLDRLAAAVRSRVPPRTLAAGGRYAPLVAIATAVAVYSAALSDVRVARREEEGPRAEDAAAQEPSLHGETLAPAAGTEPAAPGLSPATTAAQRAAAIARQVPPPPTANVCGKSGILDTGPAIQFPWAVQCLPNFTGDNGGPTYRGVYRDKIRVAYYITTDPVIIGATKSAGGCGEEHCTHDYYRGYVDWFSKYYQLYGRRIELVPFPGGGRENDVDIAISDAREIIIDKDVFAVLGGPGETGAVFAEELANADPPILCFCTTSLPQELYEANPYIWSTLMAASQAHIHRAEYIGKRLAGRNAEWAGSAALRGRKREFGLVWFNNKRGDYRPSKQFFERQLAGYQVTLRAAIEYTDLEGCQKDAINIAQQLAGAEVTSVILLVDPLCPIYLTQAAQGQLARWEWLVMGSALTDTNNFGRLYNQEQWQRAFGVGQCCAPDVRNENEYWYRMFKEVRPSGDSRGDPPKEEAAVFLSQQILFFTGVHLAGPKLTPGKFREGMAKAVVTGGTVTIARRSYGPKTVGGYSFWDFTAYDDMAELWWDPLGTDLNGRPGTYWYVDGGRRHQWETWPATEVKAFVKDGATFGYERAPDQP